MHIIVSITMILTEDVVNEIDEYWDAHYLSAGGASLAFKMDNPWVWCIFEQNIL